MKKYSFFIFCSLLIGLSVLFAMNYKFCFIRGMSMYPTLQDSSIHVITRNIEDITYNDIVVIHIDSCDREIVKRVIGLGGDSIKITDNRVFVNDNEITEDYLFENMMTDDLCVKVPQGYIFVLGDNRNVSLDSRDSTIGCIPLDSVIGKLM